MILSVHAQRGLVDVHRRLYEEALDGLVFPLAWRSVRGPSARRLVDAREPRPASADAPRTVAGHGPAAQSSCGCGCWRSAPRYLTASRRALVVLEGGGLRGGDGVALPGSPVRGLRPCLAARCPVAKVSKARDGDGPARGRGVGDDREHGAHGGGGLGPGKGRGGGNAQRQLPLVHWLILRSAGGTGRVAANPAPVVECTAPAADARGHHPASAAARGRGRTAGPCRPRARGCRSPRFPGLSGTARSSGALAMHEGGGASMETGTVV